MGLSTQPIGEYIYVTKPDATKAGSLFVTAPADPAAPRLAEVLAVGPGRASDYTGDIIPMPNIEPGDSILIHGGAGIRLPAEDGNVYAIFPRDIIGIGQTIT